jgi:hypothetical protein
LEAPIDITALLRVPDDETAFVNGRAAACVLEGAIIDRDVAEEQPDPLDARANDAVAASQSGSDVEVPAPMPGLCGPCLPEARNTGRLPDKNWAPKRNQTEYPADDCGQDGLMEK